MLKFLQLGSERHRLEAAWWRRLACRAVGHRGLGYAVKLWALERLLRGIPTGGVRHVLDFGCGDGMYTFYLARRFGRAAVTGLDGDPAAIRAARQMHDAHGTAHKQLRFVAHRFEDCSEDSIEPAAYDLVSCLDCVHYTPAGLDHLGLVCRSVRPGGYLVFSSPRLGRYYGDGFSYYTGWVDVGPLTPLYEPASTRAAIQAAGLEICDELHYPGRVGAAAIRWQRRRPHTAALLYPALLGLTWLGRCGSSQHSTHYMYLARRPEDG